MPRRTSLATDAGTSTVEHARLKVVRFAMRARCTVTYVVATRGAGWCACVNASHALRPEGVCKLVVVGAYLLRVVNVWAGASVRLESLVES